MIIVAPVVVTPLIASNVAFVKFIFQNRYGIVQIIAKNIQAKNTVAKDSDFFMLSISFCSTFLIENKNPKTTAITPVVRNGIIALYSFNKTAQTIGTAQRIPQVEGFYLCAVAGCNLPVPALHGNLLS